MSVIPQTPRASPPAPYRGSGLAPPPGALPCTRWEPYAGVDPGFQVRGAHLKKLRRAEGGAKIFGVFRVKNHDFTPKKNIFLILGGVREIFGVFYVKNHDFTTKKIIFLPILGGGGRAPGSPPLNPPLVCGPQTPRLLTPPNHKSWIRP